MIGHFLPNNTMTLERRFPAEWEKQSGVLIAWPHAGTDWAARLTQVEHTYMALVAAITRFQPVLICVADNEIHNRAQTYLRENAVDLAQVGFIQVAYNDTWLRDSGPITLHGAEGSFELMDFRFTGWGGKFAADTDDQLVSALFQAGIFNTNTRLHSVGFALEGGAVETDGAGTLLTTWQCLHARHPHCTRDQLNAQLMPLLAQQRVLWLENGALQGDDTDAHIDTLARFAWPNSIVYQACDQTNDNHYAPLQAMAQELAALRTIQGQPYHLFALPWPQPIVENGRRLAASYANFLIINGAVLMPAYGDKADEPARAVLAQAFPHHEIIPIDCRALIWQNGSLHCITMQLPAGLVLDHVIGNEAITLNPDVAAFAQALRRLEDFLRQHGDDHWSGHLAKCAYEAEHSDGHSLHRYRSLHGGMGSLNDFLLSYYADERDQYVNQTFNELKACVDQCARKLEK